MYTVQITVASVYPRILSVTEQGTYILMHEVYYCKSVFSILKEIGELYFYFRGWHWIQPEKHAAREEESPESDQAREEHCPVKVCCYTIHSLAPIWDSHTFVPSMSVLF